MADVFLSYARTDLASAKRVADALAACGWTVWWDRTIPPGRTFDDVLEEALDHARSVVVLWSKTSVASHWVKAEAAEGARRNILVPVLLESVKIPLEFRRVQAADLTGWTGEANHPEFVKVVQSIATLAPPTHGAGNRPASQTGGRSNVAFDTFERPDVPQPVPARPGPHRSRRWLWVALTLLVVAASAAAFWWRDLSQQQTVDQGGSEPRPAPASAIVPSLTGRSLDDAIVQLRAAGFDAGTTRYRDASVNEQPGSVVAQRPAAGEHATNGASVDLVVARAVERSDRSRSGNPSQVEVPALVGLSLEQAQDRLTRRHLTLGTVERRVDEVFAQDAVMEQSPPASTRLDPGSAVSVIVAERPPVTVPPAIRVPNIVGLSERVAADLLKRSSLKVGTMTKRVVKGSKPGMVLTQSPAAGTPVAIGEQVTFEIAAAPVENPPPESPDRTSTVNTATNFRAFNPSSSELTVEFDVYYTGSQGTFRISVQACPTDPGKKKVDGLSCERSAIHVGRNHVTVTITMQEAKRAESVGVELCLIGSAEYFGCQVFSHTKRWSQ